MIFILFGVLGLVIVLWFAGCSYNYKKFQIAGDPLSGSNDFIIQIDMLGTVYLIRR